MEQKHKAQKLKILISAKLTEEEYEVVSAALQLYAETLYEQGLDDHVALTERAYKRLTGFKLTGHK
jgi:hypothetical protein